MLGETCMCVTILASIPSAWAQPLPSVPYARRDFCLEVPAGNTVALVGESGSGEWATGIAVMLEQPEG